jgi:hypothetical protein
LPRLAFAQPRKFSDKITAVIPRDRLSKRPLHLVWRYRRQREPWTARRRPDQIPGKG